MGRTCGEPKRSIVKKSRHSPLSDGSLHAPMPLLPPHASLTAFWMSGLTELKKFPRLPRKPLTSWLVTVGEPRAKRVWQWIVKLPIAAVRVSHRIVTLSVKSTCWLFCAGITIPGRGGWGKGVQAVRAARKIGLKAASISSLLMSAWRHFPIVHGGIAQVWSAASRCDAGTLWRQCTGAMAAQAGG